MDSTQTPEAEQEYSAHRISEYFLELESILGRIESSATYYQILGLDKAALPEKVKLAYSETVAVLKPSSNLITLSMPPEMTERIDAAFEKVGEAFSVLMNYGKRIEYNNSLSRKIAVPLPFDIPIGFGRQHVADPEPVAVIDAGSPLHEAFNEFANEVPEDNRRRCERFKLSIPVRLTGHDESNGKWAEMAQTLNVNRLGISIRLRHRVRHGTVVYVTLPLPVKLRNHGHADPSYGVYAIVRRIELPENGTRIVGFEFLGEHPPRGYLEKPWKVFRTVKWVGPDRRHEPRKIIAEPVEVHYLDETLTVCDCQLGLTENVSYKGARVYVRTPPPEFDWIRIVARSRSFDSRASLRNRFVGSDGYDRLCLEFVDSNWTF